MLEVNVRKVTMEDVELVRALRLKAVRDAPYAFSANLADFETRPVEKWQQRVETWVECLQAMCFLGFADTAVGMCGVEWQELPRANLVALWVDPAARGAGVAEALVEAVCDQARRKGAREISTCVFEENARAFRFYDRCGFKRIEVRRSVPGRDSAEVLNLKRL